MRRAIALVLLAAVSPVFAATENPKRNEPLTVDALQHLATFLPFAFGASRLPTSEHDDKSPISVGENLQVSKPNPTWHHDEIILSVDPTNPKRMIACSIVIVPETAQRTDVIYTSHDGGASWRETLRIPEQSSDPICQFGPDGTAYFAVENVIPEGVEIYVSTDGGLTWIRRHRQSLELPGYDRHFFAVDDTGGKYHGRIYIDAWTFVRSVEAEGRENTFEGIGLYHSDDRGMTWSDPIKRVSGGYDVRIDLPGNCDVFTNGGLICPFFQNTPPSHGSAEGLRALRVVTAPPGGESLSTATTVAEAIKIQDCPHLATDRWTRQFRNRAYAVWSAKAGETADIWSSYSVDQGLTWSRPVMVNDDHRNGAAPTSGHELPQIAVNREGVVGVLWYDHREDPKGHASRPRFAASLDGGETFLPSVAVASAPHTVGKGEHWVALVTGDSTFEQSAFRKRKPLHPLTSEILVTNEPGDTSSLVADSTGVFWGLWIDNRTRYDQMWTAPIHVQGKPVRHGSPELAVLDDLSEKVVFHYGNVSVDDSRKLVSVTVQIKNLSEHDLRGPLIGRVLALKSEIGAARIVNAENGEAGLRATWRFDVPSADGVLKPGALTAAKKLTFEISNPAPLHETGKSVYSNVVSFDLQVLGKLVERPADRAEEHR
jgi:hypothetical protein